MDCFASLAMTARAMDCFAEPVIGRAFGATRWLAMTVSCDHRATLSGCHRPRRRLRIYLRPHPRVTASPLSLEELAKQASRRRAWDSRHCERSEAIHSFFTRRDGLLRFARNDGAGEGLLRGACHRARIRATRWLAMTVSCDHRAALSVIIARGGGCEYISDLIPRNGFAVIAGGACEASVSKACLG